MATPENLPEELSQGLFIATTPSPVRGGRVWRGGSDAQNAGRAGAILPQRIFLSVPKTTGLKPMAKFVLKVNGAAHEVEADPATPLIYVLRGKLGLTGPKIGCAKEQCGACTVLVDGEATQCCVRSVAEFEGADIRTIEGLAEDETGKAVQEAFVALNAAQCGYCTPGLVTTATALLKRNARPDRAEIKQALETNLCRCGSHSRVLAAIERAAGGGRHAG